MASLVEHLALGPMQVVGASTSGAIGQYMALDHPHTVRTLTMFASFARFDTFILREFEVRRKMAAEWDRHATFSGCALFLFSPKYTREHPDWVTAWIERGDSAAHGTGGPRDCPKAHRHDCGTRRSSATRRCPAAEAGCQRR